MDFSILVSDVFLGALFFFFLIKKFQNRSATIGSLNFSINCDCAFIMLFRKSGLSNKFKILLVSSFGESIEKSASVSNNSWCAGIDEAIEGHLEAIASITGIENPSALDGLIETNAFL